MSGMGGDLGKGVFELVIDDKQLAKLEAAKAKVAAATGGMAQATEQSGGRIGSAMGRVGQAVVAAGGITLGNRLAGSLKSTGDVARSFQDQISGAASATGVSVERLSNIANGFRFIPPSVAAEGLKNLVQIQTAFGKTGDEAVKAAQAQLEVAQAASVVLGVPVAGVVDGIAAAYRGEYDSLQRVIPSITAKRIEDEAMAISGKASTEALTGQEKAQAAQNIIMQEGARLTDQLGQNTDTAAAKQKEAAASSDRAKVSMGGGLLPVMSKVSEVLGTVAGAFGSLPGPVQTIVVALAGFGIAATYITAAASAVKALGLATHLAAAGAKIAAAAQWVWNAAMAANPIGLVIVAIVAIVAVLVLVYTKFEWFRGAVAAVWGFLKGAVGGAVSFIAGVLGGLVGFIASLPGRIGGAIGAVIGFFGRLAGAARDRVGDVIGFFTSLPGRILGAIGDLGRALMDKGRDIVMGLVRGIGSAAGAVRDALLNLVPAPLRGPLGFLFGRSPSPMFMQFGKQMMQGAELGIERNAYRLQSALVSAAPSLPGVGGMGGAGGAPALAGAAGGGGSVVINVYQSPGENGEALARRVEGYIRRRSDLVRRGG